MVSQFLVEVLDKAINSKERNVSEVNEVLANRYVQRVRPIENVGVRLEISSSLTCGTQSSSNSVEIVVDIEGAT